MLIFSATCSYFLYGISDSYTNYLKLLWKTFSIKRIIHDFHIWLLTHAWVGWVCVNVFQVFPSLVNHLSLFRMFILLHFVGDLPLAKLTLVSYISTFLSSTAKIRSFVVTLYIHWTNLTWFHSSLFIWSFFSWLGFSPIWHTTIHANRRYPLFALNPLNASAAHI